MWMESVININDPVTPVVNLNLRSNFFISADYNKSISANMFVRPIILTGDSPTDTY